MRRFFAAFLVVCVLAAGVLAMGPWWINSEHLRGRIISALEETTGRKVTFQGNARVTLSPFFGIRLSDLIVDNRRGREDLPPLMRAENALIKLNPLSAIMGQLKIRNVELQRPRFSLLKTSDGYSNWQGNSTSQNEATDMIAVPLAGSLMEIWVSDGGIDYKDEISGTSETAGNLSGKIIWPSNDEPFVFDGSLVWRNESIELDLGIDNLNALGSGKDSGATIKFISEPITVTYNGTANLQAGIYSYGTIDAKSPSISRLNDLFDLGLETNNIIGDWAANGNLEIKPNTLLLTDASVVVNGSPATGVVRFASDELGASKLDGTLALSQIDLTALATRSFLHTLTANIDRENLVVDLRMSAEQVSFGSFVIENVASTVSNSADGFNVDISDASVMSGMVIGKINITQNEKNKLMSIVFDANKINLKEFEKLYGEKSLHLDAIGNLHAEISTPLPMTEDDFRFSGSISLNAEKGTLNGITLPLVLSPDEDKSMQVENIAGASGSTAFDAIDLSILVLDNSGFVQTSTLKSGDYVLELSGITNLASGSLALRGVQTSINETPLERLQIGGTIREPLITIRRNREIAPANGSEESHENNPQ